MKKKTLYIFVIITIIILFIVFFSNYEEGLKVSTWGMNRSISWGWNFGF